MADKPTAASLIEQMLWPTKPPEASYAERLLTGQIAPPQAEARPYDPTIREQMAASLQRGLESLGADRYKARQRAQSLIGGPSSNLPLGMGVTDVAAGFNAPVGMAMNPLYMQEGARAIESAGHELSHGNYGRAALEGGFGALGMLPGVLGAARYAKPVGEATASVLANVPKVPGALANVLLSGPTPGSRAAQRGAIDLGSQLPEFQPQTSAGLVSRADEALAALPRNKGTGAEFLRELQKTPGVKPAELEDRGLIEALSGMGKVTKADALKILQDNPPVKFEEVVLGEKGRAEAKQIAAQDIAETIQAGLGDFNDDARNMLDRWRNAQPGSPMERQSAASLEEMLRKAGDRRSIEEYVDAGSAQTDSTRYGQYTLPGGENYREMLLKIPGSKPSAETESRLRAVQDRINELRPIIDRQPLGVTAERKEFNTLYDERDRLIQEREGVAYKSSHWNEPNVLAHARISDRTGPNGEKILHVEEVQSDWHQTGRKEGYKTGKEKEQISALSKQYDELTNRRRQLLKQAEEMPDGGPEFISLIDESNAITPQLMRLQEQMDSLRSAGERGVPDAPFKKNWHELMMKRLVDYAAKNGYDRIAITPGAEQASRYDLSKQVDAIEYLKHADGTVTIEATKNGRTLSRDNYPADKMPDVVGKEVAERIRQSDDVAGELSGLDLQVGGEGMKGFYDKILPTYLNELGKPYGVKVGQMDLSYTPTAKQAQQGAADEALLSELGVEVPKAKRPMLHTFDITPQMREAIKSKGLPLYRKGGPVRMAEGGEVTIPDMTDGGKVIDGGPFKKGGKVRVSNSPDAMRLAVSMQEGGSPRRKAAETILSGLKSLVKPAEGKSVLEGVKAVKPAEELPYTAKQVQSAAEKLAPKIKQENPKLSDDEAMKRALRQAEQKLKWEKVDRPELEKTYGALEKSKFNQPLAERQRNVPEVVEKRIKETQEFLKEPTEPWTPPRKELQAFERERIKDALEGFPGVEQTKFPRYEPARADLGYISEIYDDPVNRELIKGQIKRGLPLGGETFYASLYPLKLAALERGIPESKFNEFIYSIAPASARNSIMNEMAVGQFMRDMRARGLSLDEDTVKQEMAAFKQKYGTGLPLMPVHREGVKNVLEGGQDLREMLKADIPTNYKIPTYGTQKAGDFGKSMVLDVHESAGQTRGSRYHPYFTEQGGFGPTEYGAAENKMLDIAGEMGIPGGMAQAGRWFGGGELTGLKSPRGDALDLLEKQTAYTLQGMGVTPTPRNVRNYVLDMIEKGEGVLMPWFKKEGMPDVRTEKKKGGAVKKPRKVEVTDNLDAMRMAVQKRK